MIHDFVASWSLFGDSYLAGWLMAVLLPLLGVLVVARDQIFVGAAISQASVLGIAVGLRLPGLLGMAEASVLHSDAALSAAAGLFAVLASLATGVPRARGDSHESVTGFVFLVSASGAVLLMAHSPHGMEEVHRLVASTIIGATTTDVVQFLLLLGATVAVVAARSRELLLLLIDREMAQAVGMRVGRWGIGLAAWLGVVLGLSNRLAGAIFTFACLVLPPLAARSLCREVRSMFVVAPLIGLATALVAFVLAHDLDYPPGQTTAFLQCLVLCAAWAVRRVRT